MQVFVSSQDFFGKLLTQSGIFGSQSALSGYKEEPLLLLKGVDVAIPLPVYVGTLGALNNL